jgi:hypothetical protein
LAKTLGLDLLPRVRNWQDLIFYRPSPETRYRHIDALFSDDPKNVINWKLIETHWVDLMRTVISVREGRVSSVVLLRRLANDSKKNRLYRAFRELGRVVRTIVLLRYLSEPELREGIAVITNRMESFHNFSSRWLMFGNAGVISDNDPDTMEKILKFSFIWTLRRSGVVGDVRPGLDSVGNTSAGRGSRHAAAQGTRGWSGAPRSSPRWRRPFGRGCEPFPGPSGGPRLLATHAVRIRLRPQVPVHLPGQGGHGLEGLRSR